MMNYKILTNTDCYNEDAERHFNEIDEAYTKVMGCSLSSQTDVCAHFFGSRWFNDGVHVADITSLIQYLAIKDGVEFVQFENGNFGFVALYSGEENGFEIIR